MSADKTNKIPSIYVSGWRPFVGWTCGVALAYHFILQPLLIFIAVASGVTMVGLPALEIMHLIGLLGGMLGFGTLRSVEKIKGAARSNLNE